MIADEWWLINNLSLTRVIILCCLLLLNMASSCFHYGSSSSSLFLDNASWLHQDLFDPFFWGLTWLYLVLLTNPRTAEKCGHLEWFPLPSFQWHHIEVIISHPDVWISSKFLKKKLCIMMHHALWAIGITERNVQSLSIFGSRLLQDCLASGSPKLLLRQATCGKVPDEKMNGSRAHQTKCIQIMNDYDRCKPFEHIRNPSSDE